MLGGNGQVKMQKDNLFDKGILDRKATAGGANRFAKNVLSYKDKDKDFFDYFQSYR